jgi:hypothetical protein
VYSGGAARRQGRRRGWRRDVEGEEEVGEVGILVDGGSGSSHGRLRSSRRTAPPTGGSSSPSPPLQPPFSSGGSARVAGEQLPEAVRVGILPGLGGGSYSGARRGTRGRLGCAGGRAARRDGEARGRRARLWLWSSAKAQR